MSRALTDAMIRNVQPPADGRLELQDAACRGLWLRVTTGGAKSFTFRFRDQSNGRSERLSLGRYPDLALRDARQKADALRREIAEGKNPSAHKRSASARTFAVLSERYLEEHARRKKRSADADERNLRLHVLPRWADRDYTKIERSHVIELAERIMAADKPILANRVQALISKVFSFAVDADLVKSNPCTRLSKKGEETAKTRTLTDDEIRLFWAAAIRPPVSPAVGLALRLVLATGCRPGEVAGMARSELEVENGRPIGWTIPEARSKNGLAHFVPLAPLASQLVSEALELAGADSAFVFPSHRNDGSVEGHALAVAMRRLAAALPKSEATKSWRADPPTPHDLRRSCATRLSKSGVPGEDVAAILNHKPTGVTRRHYDLYDRQAEKRRALERWALILAGILEPAPANVVALHG